VRSPTGVARRFAAGRVGSRMSACSKAAFRFLVEATVVNN